jgi:hypothetical protein
MRTVGRGERSKGEKERDSVRVQIYDRLMSHMRNVRVCIGVLNSLHDQLQCVHACAHASCHLRTCAHQPSLSLQY